MTQRYRVQATTHLAMEAWSDRLIFTNIVSPSTLFDITTTNTEQRYYRALAW
jgi:hypothetical protein